MSNNSINLLFITHSHISREPNARDKPLRVNQFSSRSIRLVVVFFFECISTNINQTISQNLQFDRINSRIIALSTTFFSCCTQHFSFWFAIISDSTTVRVFSMPHWCLSGARRSFSTCRSDLAMLAKETRRLASRREENTRKNREIIYILYDINLCNHVASSLSLCCGLKGI